MLLAGALGGCATTTDEPAEPSQPAVLSMTESGLRWVDAISSDARWLVGSEPRAEGASTPKPLIRLDRETGEQRVLCDWADEDLGYCSLAEQGGIIPESPNLLLELVDDNAIRGWFPSGGVYLVDTGSGARTRIDVDTSGTPLTPTWQATDCEEGCDYHQSPRLHVTTESVSGDGRVVAFCANYEAPKEPTLYVKDLSSGELARTTVRCGITRFGREDDDDEFSDEGMSSPTISADGSVVHVSGDQSTGGEFGRVGWSSDTLYFTGDGQTRLVGGAGVMVRDGRTLYLRRGEQPEVPEADVDVQYVSYDVASGGSTPLPWMAEFLGSRPGAVEVDFDTMSSDGRLVVNRSAVHDVSTGAETDIFSLLREEGYRPTDEWRPLRIAGDGSTIVADVVTAIEVSEDSGNAAMLITGWSGEPMARATLSPVEEATSLRVDVDPDDAEGPWTFRLERAAQDWILAPEWNLLPETYTTSGATNTLTVDLPTGVYRVRVPAQNGHRGYVSSGEWIAPEGDEQ
jgi:hypothetical protein